MIIYLAGGVSGNLNPAWKKVAQGMTFTEALVNENFWQGGEGHKKQIWKDIYKDLSPIKENENISRRKYNIPAIYRSDTLRGGFSVKNENMSGKPAYDHKIRGGQELATQLLGGFFSKPYILESFYYCDEDTEKLIQKFGDFLLDSGAFTFMMNSKTVVNWEEYIEKYADFIKRNKVKKFFELDIDPVVGYKEVLRLRSKLEKLVGRQSIPVWHKNRGYDEYLKHSEEYKYIAIGGVVTKEIKKSEYRLFPKMIRDAHKNGARVHCLGFTNLAWLPKCHFDSVDSTAWTTGNRFGFIYRFDGKTMQKTDVPKGHRIADSRRAALINYTEWVKFQKYAEIHL